MLTTMHDSINEHLQGIQLAKYQWSMYDKQNNDQHCYRKYQKQVMNYPFQELKIKTSLIISRVGNVNTYPKSYCRSHSKQEVRWCSHSCTLTC